MARPASHTLRTGAVAVCLVASLAACGSRGAAPAQQASSESEPSTLSAEAAPQQQAEPAKYAVTIDGAEQTTDYSGDPALVVTYTFTNNSDEATSMMVALRDEAYQDGVECDMAFVQDVGGDSMSKVKPGSSAQVRKAYALTSSSPVEIEVTELFSFDKTVLAQATINVA